MLPPATYNQTGTQVASGVGRDSPDVRQDSLMGTTPPGVWPRIVPVKAASPTEDEWVTPPEYQTWSVNDAMKTLRAGWKV